MQSIEWRDIPGYEGLYEVSDDGQVRRGDRVRKLERNPVSGYLSVSLYAPGRPRRNVTVHRLVAMAFHGMPGDQTVARHLNGNRLDNRAANLAWGTYSQNERDSVAHGTHYSHFRDVAACIHGHPFDEANTAAQKGGRACRACSRRRTAEYRQRKAGQK